VSGEPALTIEVRPERWSKVSIVGLGVIGGSMARALRQRLPQLELVGVDRAEIIAGAPRTLVDECIIEVDLEAVQRAFATSDLVFLAAPIHAIQRWLNPALAYAALVTDCGSTKRELARAAQASPSGSRFVPGHPMAGVGSGAARSGATHDLFEGWPWVLCPEGVDPQALAAVEQLVALVGARPVHMAAAQHDWAVALTSHAPRLAASVLTALVEREGAFVAAGPAFERLMRGAGGAPEMWRDVLQTNADEVARALRLIVAELGACADELERAQVDRSLGTLAAAERAREALEEQHTPRR
jgi:prephenate dehydrogenase